MSLEDISLEQRDQLALLMKDLSDNPSTRKETLRLVKQLRPSMSVPELDLEDKTNTALQQMRSENEKIRGELMEARQLESLEKKRAQLIANGKARNDEDIKEIEKVMLEKRIPDHETAAEYWDWMKQSAAPTPTGYNPSALGKFDLSKYMKNPIGAARNEAAAALNELRGNRRPIGI